jgi:hypothetical protein
MYFVLFWYLLLPFGVFCGRLVYFPHFGILYQGKSGIPGSKFNVWRIPFVVFISWQSFIIKSFGGRFEENSKKVSQTVQAEPTVLKPTKIWPTNPKLSFTFVIKSAKLVSYCA